MVTLPDSSSKQHKDSCHRTGGALRGHALLPSDVVGGSGDEKSRWYAGDFCTYTHIPSPQQLHQHSEHENTPSAPLAQHPSPRTTCCSTSPGRRCSSRQQGQGCRYSTIQGHSISCSSGTIRWTSQLTELSTAHPTTDLAATHPRISTHPSTHFAATAHPPTGTCAAGEQPR